MERNALQNEMVRTKSNINNLVEKNKDLDPTYVNKKLEKHNELLQYYSILHTKQQMDDSNVEPNKWWELA
jgi:hypothetical protein